MINFCRGSLIAITILYLISHPASAQTVKTRHETWLSSPPLQQLYSEGLDDQKGMGRIFVPSITNPNNEPFYAVFRNDELVGERNMGASFFLLPGAYTVVLGSGTFDQRIHKDIEVRLEETVIIEPDWCALTIEIIDESRNNFRQDLQVFDVTTATPIAVLPSINPELGEQLQTLLLPPGLYKILKRGRDFNTFVNFATVLLEAGSYTPFTIVIDSQTGNFTGAGIIVQGTELKQIRN